MRWINEEGLEDNFLSFDETNCLSIRRGTLTSEEREIINRHIDVTVMMLEKLPYPKHLARIPEFAGGHHERMDGKGRPKGLKRHEMSLQARIMGCAEVFEALTAKDRPYKKGKTLSESLKIMGTMAEEQHIDQEVFTLLIDSGVFQDYANSYVDPSQFDEIDPSKLRGYLPKEARSNPEKTEVAQAPKLVS
jgi:response regulator RpfG family c-di-GMP phosphodiesterase